MKENPSSTAARTLIPDNGGQSKKETGLVVTSDAKWPHDCASLRSLIVVVFSAPCYITACLALFVQSLGRDVIFSFP